MELDGCGNCQWDLGAGWWVQCGCGAAGEGKSHNKGPGVGTVCCPGCALSLAGAPGSHWSCFPIGITPGEVWSFVWEHVPAAGAEYRQEMGGKIKLKSMGGAEKKAF